MIMKDLDTSKDLIRSSISNLKQRTFAGDRGLRIAVLYSLAISY